MPYYREEFANRVVQSSYTLNGALVNSGPLVLDSTEVMGFRARPHSDASYFAEVSSLSADPYAYFLDSTSKQKYRARLKERGLKSKGDPDRGHAFELKRHTITGQLYNITRTYSGQVYNYANCMVYPSMITSDLGTIHQGTVSNPAPYKESALDAFAQQAYVRVAPTAVVFDAALFLGELREGLPKLIPNVLMDLGKLYKNIGKDYLNVEFGWKPFLSDLQDIGRALAGATDMLAQEGKRVHRRYSLPPLLEAGSLSNTKGVSLRSYNHGGVASHYPVGTSWAATDVPISNVQYDLLKTRRASRWFEGEFSSFYPLGFDPSDYLSRLSVLLNPEITPSTLWALAPWSWLVDWSLHVDDTIRANEMNANDLLVMHYGYAMEHSVYATNVSWRALTATTTGWTGVPRSGFVQGTTEYKRRLRANPYGFRVGGGSSLTGGQTAILGALGLTKLK